MAATPDNGGQDLSIRVPPRYWWLKRFAIGAGTVLVLMTGLRIWWGVAADRSLERKIAELRSAGFGVYPEDADWEFAGDSAGVQRWREVLAATSSIPPVPRFTTSDPNNPLYVGDILADPNHLVAREEEALALLAACRVPLDLLRDAREVDNGDWARPWGANLALGPVDGSPWRALAKAASDAAMYAHHQGDHAATLAYVRDTLAVRRALAQRKGEVEDALTCDTIGELVMRSIETMGYTLAIEPHECQPGVIAASRAEVLSLVNALLDDGVARGCWRSAMHRERYRTLDSLDSHCGTPPPVSWPPDMTVLYMRATWWLFEPAWRRGAAHMLDTYADSERGLLAPLFPDDRDRRFWSERGGDEIGDWTRFGIDEGSMRIAVLWTHRERARRRMAAIALAMRMHVLDHGRVPAKLDALVPEYLDRLPADPFSATGSTFGYISDTKPVWLYSVGEDGADDGGMVTLEKTGERVPRGVRVSLAKMDRTCSDILFRYGPMPVVRMRPSEASSPRPVPDDDGDIQRDPNDADGD
ncbi:MAG: hypothetical protein JXO22_11440 [Phycisphaerae bacterium]|nr:hypothetical protein [Phycisphaerae bacterium]